MNNKKPKCFHDPKIQPPPAELVELTVESSREELRAIDEVIRADGFRNRAEFIRATTAEGHPFISQEQPIESHAACFAEGFKLSCSSG